MPTPQDQRYLDTARRLYEGDEAERRAIAENITWHVPGHNPVSGLYRGYQEYTEVMPARMAPLDRWDFTLESVMVNGEMVMTTYRLAGERHGRTVDLRGGHLLRMTPEGQVAEGWGFVDDQDALDAFFAA
jgi:ketosteroid isomerase-like protein